MKVIKYLLEQSPPPPELSESATRARKRGYPTSSSSDTIDHGMGNTEYAFALLPCPHASGSVFLTPLVMAKSRLSLGYKGDLPDKIPGKQSPSIIMSPSSDSQVFGPAPSSQRTLDIRHTKSAESKLAPAPGLQSDERPLSHVKDAYFHEFLLFLQSKNLGSVTPEMLKRSHVPDSSVRSSGDSSGDAATEGFAGLIATSASTEYALFYVLRFVCTY
ncbi:hypothetical protein C8J57DRAFT_1220235 [Mycena rebaudengoi]|nr:hypothetical protein C8J57DRAFT_1220235 [Mycena rebaudengoi]